MEQFLEGLVKSVFSECGLVGMTGWGLAVFMIWQNIKLSNRLFTVINNNTVAMVELKDRIE